LVKGIQAALTRRSDPPLTKLAPPSPRGKGADDADAVKVVINGKLLSRRIVRLPVVA